MKDVSLIRQRYKDGLDLDWYDKAQALQIFLTGDYKILNSYLGQTLSSPNESGDLPDYAPILPRLNQKGLQNHGLVNARINIQNTVYAKPEFVVDVDNGMLRKMLAAWLMAHWRMDQWSRKFYRAGLQYEAIGLGQCEVGIVKGMVKVRYRSIMDSVFPRLYDDPSEWPYWFVRERVPVDEAWERYGTLFASRDEFDTYLTELPFPLRDAQIPSDNRTGVPVVKCLHVWRYYDVDGHHMEFLGSVMNEGKSCPVRLDSDFNREKITDGMAGINPFGERIPAGFWVDSYCPGIAKPVGKAETTIRIAAMLNEVEEAIVKFFRRSPPQTFLNPQGLDPAMIAKLKESKSIDDIWEVVIAEGASNIGEIMLRVPAAEIGPTWWAIRAALKDELSAATGLAEVFRGIPIGGERRTKKEVEETMRTWGVQPRHLAMTYANFLVQICQLARHIGGRFETVEIPLMMQEGMLTTKNFPMDAILNMPLELNIRESSLTAKTEEDVLAEEISKLVQVDIPGIRAGVNDPYKVFLAFYEKIGEDPAKKMYTLQEYQMRQAAIMAQAALSPPEQQGAVA